MKSARCLTLAVAVSLFSGGVVSAQQGSGQKGKPKPKKPTEPSIVWVNEQGDKKLPKGVTHRTFRSEAAGQDVGYCLYLPPGYDDDANKDRRYPVIYNLHGNGERVSQF